MKWLWYGTLCSLVLIASPARADDREDCLKIVEKAIKAGGGEEKLAKTRVAHWKGKGTFYGMGDGIEYTGEWWTNGTDKIRFDLAFEAGGMKFVFSQVYNGKEGWRKVNENVMELGKDEIAEIKESFHAETVASLVTLKDKAFTLSPLGEVKIENKPAVGIKVSKKGHRDINLFFDKESGLLVKVERRVVEMGNEADQEELFSGYQEVSGAKIPFKVKINRDGKLFVEGETTEYKLVDKHEDSVFAKPAS